MNPRELNNELQRLKQMAKSLLSAIEALQTRVDVAADGNTVPPPARPTTRIRRVAPSKSLSGQMQAARDEEPPSTRPGAGGNSSGAYRHVAKKR